MEQRSRISEVGSPTHPPVVEIDACHHVALRCRDAQETVDFYAGVLGMRFEIATREHIYRGQPCNFTHVFLQMKDGNFLSFFEVPGLKPQGRDPNTPAWVQHFALRVSSPSEVEKAKAALEARGFRVDGPVVRPPFCSIYFADPSGNRMEITAVGAHEGTRYAMDEENAREVLRVWAEDKRSGAAHNAHVPDAI
jgi:glyoxylase I family protein